MRTSFEEGQKGRLFSLKLIRAFQMAIYLPIFGLSRESELYSDTGVFSCPLFGILLQILA